MATAKPKRYTVDRKAVTDLRAGIKGLNDTQLECRDMRHAWKVEEPYHVEPSQHAGRRIEAVRRVLVCMRGCEVRRVEHYASTRGGLDKISQHYVYPEGYEIPGVPRGVKPSIIIQQESYRRFMEAVAGKANAS